MKDILFLDIETDRKGRIQDYGALFRGQELHESHTAKLETWIKEAKIICGHNILNHDIPELKKIFDKGFFEGKEFIDTLLWSPLIFSENPYHKLVKGYKIVNESDVNNPLSDCKLSRDLLLDELVGFKNLEESYRNIIVALLAANNDFKSFLRFIPDAIANSGNLDSISSFLDGKVCKSVDIHEVVKQHPVELAYALAIIRLENNESILPSWVRYQYPGSEKVLEQLRFTSCVNKDCQYCSSKLNPVAGLQTYFGYSDFRKFDQSRSISLQEETVRAGLQNHSFVAVFPTGGGKSLTFQLPALMRGDATRHLTVVISPLVSLMKDQVDNLLDRFQITKAVAINGLLSPLERKEALERVEMGGAHILYVSPESLRSPTILRIISSRSIARFVIDEAHCFSSWGQDFRVDYLYIAEFIKKLQTQNEDVSIPVSCFTATAKPQVIDDIKKYFNSKLGLELKEFITQKGRENLSYEVIEVEDSEGKKKQLKTLLRNCERPVIIYASRTRQVEEVAAELNGDGLPVTYFHGRLDKDVKKRNMDLFMSNQAEVIVATSAFGMGVDKEDVRTVIHYNISDSLENYIQEAGRAGRKESIQAKCYILYNESDLNKHFSLLQHTKLNKKEIEEVWRALKHQSRYRKKISQSALEIAKQAGWDTEINELDTKVTTAISALENQGFLKREQNSPAVFADSLMVKNYSRGQELILDSNNISTEDQRNCSRVLKRIITDKETRVDYLADSTELSMRVVQDCIRILRSLSILGDAKDLTAFVNILKSKNGSESVAIRHLQLEKQLIEWFSEKNNINISLRQLNQNMIDAGILGSGIDSILRILNYWEIQRFISKRRVDREKEVYKIKIRNYQALAESILWRDKLTRSALRTILNLATDQKEKNHSRDQVPVRFSLLELRDQDGFMGQENENNTWQYEQALLYLNQIKAIKLEGGFMVVYNRLNIQDIKSKEKPIYKVEDYSTIQSHYQHKTEQIHIVGEYAKKCIEKYEKALSYVNDYFTLDYEEFLALYFPKRKTEIRRPLTATRFAEVIKDLDLDQAKVLNDNSGNDILVLAGPGSGKTKVLVHKIANLLLLEDIKPEQFLMLTFSKSAVMEFKFRTRQLVPEFASLIKISTFHGFCFELLGQLGDLVKSQNIIRECTEGIKQGNIDTTSISNKSVLLLDEFQDINLDEWNLIQEIIKAAGHIRVIAVGDDDQNIYEFRGSSNEYMKNFGETDNVIQYNLLKNYRSRSGIIAFNNQILKRIPNRLKKQDLVSAKKTPRANIQLVKYPGRHLINPIVESVFESTYGGTRAVLVRTNYEAIIVSSLLEENGVHTRLLAGFEGFSMASLEEIRSITRLFQEKVEESGLIYEDDWYDSIEGFRNKFHGTPHFKACIDILNKFDKAYPEKKLLVDWYEYIRQINMEDAVHPDSTSVIVSTMHKAKGKEFDHVWLLLDNYDFSSSEAKRLVYVACSRARQSLSVHTNSNFFDNIDVEDLSLVNYQEQTSEPTCYELILSHKDVNLSSQKFYRAKRTIDKLKTGDRLRYHVMKFDDSEAPGLAKDGEGNMLLFSRDFVTRKLHDFQSRGFHLAEARVEYLVYWYDREEEKEYKIVLPRLRFEKNA